jgi:hypothetical protein
MTFDAKNIREHAEKFDKKIFQEKLLCFIKKKMNEINL